MPMRERGSSLGMSLDSLPGSSASATSHIEPKVVDLAASPLNSSAFPKNPDKRTAKSPSKEASQIVWGADDGGADDMFDLQFQEQTIFDNVKAAVVQHRQFLRLGQVPFQEVLKTLESYQSEGYRPAPGTVVEGLNHKLEWKCCVVSHTYLDSGRREKDVMTAYVKQDANLKGQLDQGNDPDEVRPVRSGVRATFGDTPMFWMQRTVLLAEQQMRFERFHCWDFEEVNWIDWFQQRFFFWVGMRRASTEEAAGSDDSARWVPTPTKDVDNGPFQELFAAAPDGCKDALFDLVKEPFAMMHAITHDWFDGCAEQFSCYTYLSVLGHDWAFCLFALAIQTLIPVTLLAYNTAYYETRLFCEDTEDVIFQGDCIQAVEDTYWCTRRTNPDAWMGRWMIFAIMLFYMAKVVPDLFSMFVSNFGGEGATDSEGAAHKLGALRKAVFDADRDTLLTRGAHRVDLVMNSAYQCGLYLLNILILYTTDDVANILINCLAIEFVGAIDESFTSMDWYDTDCRYLKAGAVEMVIRRYVDFADLDKRLTPDGPAQSAAEAERARDEGLKLRTAVKPSDPKEDDAADEDTLDFTASPKHHFYGFVNVLQRKVQLWGRAKRSRGKAWWHSLALPVAKGLLALGKGEPCIFDKWSDKFLDPSVSASWKGLVYAQPTAALAAEKFGPGSEFLSLERTRARRAAAEPLRTRADWKRAVADAASAAKLGDGDADEVRVLKEWRERTSYREPKVTAFVSAVKAALLFQGLPGDLARALRAGKVGRAVFAVFSAATRWVSAAVQLTFPVLFTFLFIAVPACY